MPYSKLPVLRACDLCVAQASDAPSSYLFSATCLTSGHHLQCALLANSAGIGGGPFYVPLLNVVLGFDLKAATGLSHTIVGAHRQFLTRRAFNFV